MKHILYIGSAPQNIGGISIHIRRLVGLVKDAYLIDYVDEGHTRYDEVFNLRCGNLFKYFEKVTKANIVHVHSGMWLLRAFHIIVCKVLMRKKVLVTVHRDPNIEPHTGMTKWLLKKCDYAILVNREGYEAMRTESKCKYVLLPAFLPPAMDEEPQLPTEIEKWISNVRGMEGVYLMCSNAWNLVMYNGEDLYGLDMCIEAMKTLEKKFYLLFVVATNTKQQARMAGYKEQIKANGLEENILIWEQPTSFVRLVQQCDLVLRTTNTDGDAISIREALYFGKPVLASDVVKRPDGVCLFKTRDTADLIKRIKEIEALRGQVQPTEKVDFRTMYLNMYD